MMRDKRLILLCMLLAALALSFWLGSRYPDLSVKAEAGPGMMLDGLGFDVVYPVGLHDTFMVVVAKRTVNWLVTNKKGMLFGLLVAAALEAVFSLMRSRTLGSRWRDTLLGVTMGAPLGLCVNCAAPVGTGLHRGGSRMETTAAMVLSSPTLNVIVLSFVFSMLPLHMGLMKVAFTAVLILGGVPLIARWAEGKDPRPPGKDETCPAPSPPPDGWLSALLWVVKTFFWNFIKLFARLVPLMVLAGFLGSLLVSWLSFDELGRVPAPSVGRLALVSLVCTLLPVPMAFDVILCALLYQGGMPPEYVMVMLFTLGTFSVLTFEILRQTVSARLAVAIFFCVFSLGLVGGLLARPLDAWYADYLNGQLLTALTKAVKNQIPPTAAPKHLPCADDARLRETLAKGKLAWTELAGGPGFGVSRRPFSSPSPHQNTLFSRENGASLGLESPIVLSYRDHWDVPARTNRAMANADIHNDGWVDLVIGNDFEVGGLTLFANVGGKFQRQTLDLGPQFNSEFIPVAALVDINGDGWADLFFATYQGDNRILLNEDGQFGSKLIELPSFPGACLNAVGFGDIDEDGDLDMVAGTWVHQYAYKQQSRLWDYLVTQDKPLHFVAKDLPGRGGNTHSVLFSDLDGDGLTDLAIANDWDPPDQFFKGLGKGKLKTLGAYYIPGCPRWTMSLDSADLDNDGDLELFSSHIAFQEDVRKRVSKARGQDLASLLEADEIETMRYMTQAEELHRRLGFSHRPSDCFEDKNATPGDVRDCLHDVLLWRSREPRTKWEKAVPSDDRDLATVFDRLFPVDGVKAPQGHQPGPPRPITSSVDKNTLLEYDGKEKWTDQTAKWGLGYTYWGWNSKFADLDLDGYQDLFVANGSFQDSWLTPNLLFLNQAGKTLKRVDDQALADFFPTSNSAYIDFDNDGDLDIIAAPPNGTIRVFRNGVKERKAIAFALLDHRGNGDGIGAKVLIKGAFGQQLRELKTSGGFSSFDAPIAWFGVGSNGLVDSAEVRWLNGGVTTLKGPLEAGHIYRVTRR